MYLLLTILLSNPVIQTEAARFDIDPALVVAIIEVESGSDASAVGPKGSIGLMQIQPTTGEWIAIQCQVEWDSGAALLDEKQNIKLGVCYLRMLLNQFQDETLALAAYNWGPGRVERTIYRDQSCHPLPTHMMRYPDLVRSKLRN